MRYRYAGVIAINPNTEQSEVVKSATGTVHINEDWETPVVVQDPNGFAMTTLNTTVEGLFPDFYVEDQPVVGFKTSSGHRFYLRSSTPVPGPAGPVPESVTTNDGALEFRYPDGKIVGGPSVPSPEALADEQIAVLVQTSDTKTGAAVYGAAVSAVAEAPLVVDAAASAVTAAASAREARAKGITCRGDSHTAGQGGNGLSYPMELSKLLPGIPVEKRGYPGETPASISVRQGSTPLLVTFTDGVIPASGNATITIKNGTTTNRMFFGADATIGVPEGRAAVGTVGGVHGEIRGNASSGYTFARTTAGHSAPVVADMPFVDSWESTHRDWHQIIMAGRNGTDAALAVDMVGKMAKFQTGGDYVVLSVITRVDEKSGTAGYNYVKTVNDALKAAHGTRFVDVRKYLVAKALADLGLTPTAADTEAINADTVPPQLMDADLLHPNANGYRAIATYVHTQIVNRGWTGQKPKDPVAALGVDDYSYRYIVNRSGVTDGAAVGSVSNEVEFGAALQQPSTAAQPVARVSGGDAYLSLDGADDFLAVSGYSANHPVSVVMVARANDAAGVSKTYARFTTSSTPQAVATTGAAASTFNWTVRGTSTAQGPHVTISDGKFHTLGAVIDGTPGGTGMGVASVDTATARNSMGNVQTINKLSFGDSGADVGFAKMDIAEVIVWNRALTEAELVTVHNALKAQHPTLLV